ncbi:XRE family transcriptional regulator [Geobacillus sp. T6]|uniref:helix-turn-helix domain-containing protein n=1 Tax=Geobacillus sp. T6 TaxID=1659191 RepID=UPI00064B4645|nr:helix-turn-helix transcriptional regulator [Geobacillus sp. T6]KLR75304.1 XRE family transcriptional regulator [Geobacillus sp. T6]
MSILGSRLKKLREKHNLTQERAGEIFGLTKYQIHRYESGASNPDPDIINRFADYYGVSTDYLLGRTDHPNPPEQDDIPEELKDPELGLFFKELAEAPEERREQLLKIWEILKSEGDRKPNGR